jgi:hypothetical protein
MIRRAYPEASKPRVFLWLSPIVVARLTPSSNAVWLDETSRHETENWWNQGALVTKPTVASRAGQGPAPRPLSSPLEARTTRLSYEGITKRCLTCDESEFLIRRYAMANNRQAQA